MNSAQWVLWGIVQAKIPGMVDEDVEKTPRPETDVNHNADVKAQILPDESGKDPDSQSNHRSETNGDVHQREDKDNEEGFDYLAYARERAAFFWGDVICQGVMTADELPDDVVQQARILDY
jgi:choline kinase